MTITTTIRSFFLYSFLDLATLSFIFLLLLLSVLSAFFIFNLRIRSRSSPCLREFNSLWDVKLLLVYLVAEWAAAELLRAQLFRRTYTSAPPLPVLPYHVQANLCKIHTVISFGFLEPAFLVTILFLLNASARKTDSGGGWAVAYVLVICIPQTCLQAFFAYFPPVHDFLPDALAQSSVHFSDGRGHETVLCSYPLLGTAVFAAFAVTYCICFIISCRKVVSLVINKGLRSRIYALSAGILIPLPTQLLLQVMSVFWSPEQRIYSGIDFCVFVFAMACAAAGEGILIITPSTDVLAAEGDLAAAGIFEGSMRSSIVGQEGYDVIK